MKADKVLVLINKLLEEGSTGYLPELLAMKEECKAEIATQVAKSSGGRDEVKRKKAAERIFKNTDREVLQGYKQYEDGKIALTDGFVVYYGKPIAGIVETKQPSSYPDVLKFFESSNTANYIAHKISLTEIKTNYKMAKAEAKAKNIKKHIYNCVDGASVILDNGTNIKTHISSEYLITACELLGGDEFIVKTQNNHLSPVIIEHDNGMVLVMPYKPTETNVA